MPPRLAALACAALLLGCTPKPSQGSSAGASSAPVVEPAPAVAKRPTRGIHYRFRLDERASLLAGEICFDGLKPTELPKRLEAPMGRAAPFLRGARHRGKPLAASEGAIALAGVEGCVEFDVDVARLLDGASRHDGVGWLGDDLLLSPDWWLWAPAPRPEGVPIRARFEGPLAPALPWPRGPEAGFPYEVPESIFAWKAAAAFGRFETATMKVGGAKLDVSVLGAGFGKRGPAVKAWLETSAHAAAELLGGFPVPRAQVLLLPEPGRRGTFGFAVRGGGPSASLMLPERPAQSLLDDDWTAVHELLHFALPPLPTADAWLYEGLITYFTAVARARAGMITEAEGWWELLDGFERGSRVGTGVSLRKESATMHDNRTYWRVYWSGAALALQIDVELREQGQTLAEVVAKLARDRPDDAHDWTADLVVKSLVELCGDNSPSRIVAKHLDAKAFPDTTALRRALGVELAGNTVRYDDSAPQAAIRRAIMRP